MSNSFIVNLPLVHIECRGSFEFEYRKGCPLKDFIESNESVYAAWPNDKRLLPDTVDFQRACEDIQKIREICDKCKQQHKIR